MKSSLAFLLFLAGALCARAAYHIENVPLPPGLRGGLCGIAFTPAGTLVVTTRYGEVWMRAPDGATWHRFAYGLNEPLGLVVDSESVIYVAHRPELLRISDTDGDGKADTFDALGGDWGLSNNYHEFFFGLRRDKAGNFYGAVSLDSSTEKGGPGRTRGPVNLKPALVPSYHESEVKYRGWAVKITPEGRTIPFAAGFRQPDGVGMSPDGDLFYTDNQGDYKPSCGLLHVAEGDFHGHAESLKWAPGFVPGSLTTESLWHRYKSPAVVFPQGALGVSAGEPVWDLTGGKFGPYEGEVFIGDFTNLVIRAGLEKVAGGWQGFAFPFLGRNKLGSYATGEPLAQGNERAAFAPDGSLYLAQTAGWGGGHDGLQRVSWDGRVPTDILAMHLTDHGFALTFTKPMDRAALAVPANYQFDRFRFYYQVKYGSPWIDEARVAVTAAQPSADGRKVELTLAELPVGFVYEIALQNLTSTDGEPVANPTGYYTVNRLRNGEVAVGGTTRLPRPGEDARGEKEATPKSGPELIAAGEKVYKLFCIACHQANGHGMPGGAANFVEDKTRLAKSDAELLRSISKGVAGKGMPAFGSSLKKAQQREVLAYIRATFGGQKPESGGERP